MISILLGLISLAFSVVFVVALHSFTSFDLSSFSLFFVVPVGAIAVGTFASLGYYFGILKSNKKVSAARRWIGVYIALVCFVAIQYGFYYTAYMDENNNLNFKMQGEHVSNYVIGDSEEAINFFTFTKEMVDSRVISFSRRSTQLMEVDGNKTVNWIFYVVDFLGMLVGAFVARSVVLGSKKYCDNCERYMKQRVLLKFSTSDDQRLERFRTIENIDSQEIAALVQNDGTSVDDDFYEVHLHSCESCNNGVLQLQYMEVGSNNKTSHKEEKSIDIPVAPSITKAINQPV